MSVITKSDLAKELGVSKARVSQYVKQGLPVRPDGRLNREDALNYLRVYKVSEPGSKKGPVRAAKLLRGDAVAEAVTNPQPISRHRSFRDLWSEGQAAKVHGLQAMVACARPVVAAAAIEAGASVEVAFAVVEIMQMELCGLADKILTHDQVPGWRAGDVSDGISTGRIDRIPDWDGLAKAGGQSFDLWACEAHQAALPYWQDRRITEDSAPADVSAVAGLR